MRSLCFWLTLSHLVSLGLSKVLHVDSRWILDESNTRYKLRCVNWAGHVETNIPEGLQHQPIDFITSFIASAGFNCVRLTYSIDMALGPDVSVNESFARAATDSSLDPSVTTNLYDQAVAHNPFLATASRRDVFTAVIKSLETHGVDVILDNHVSKAQWCCDLQDGNGWWDQASGYNPLTSRYFNTQNWLDGLGAMAEYSKTFPNVIGMSLRNELRSLPPQNLNGGPDWYEFVRRGATRLHETNPDLLIMVGGTEGALNLSFLRLAPFDRSAFGGKIVWEYHIYSYSPLYNTQDCDAFKLQLGSFAGFLLEQGKPYTGPLWVSEFGFGMSGGSHDGLSDQDNAYFTCLREWLESNDAEWAYWPLQGDYYIRQGKASSDESYGVLNTDWSAFRNPDFPNLFGAMWNITQRPSGKAASCRYKKHIKQAKG